MGKEKVRRKPCIWEKVIIGPLPVAVCIHECKLEADQSIQIGMVVPGCFVQEEDIPVWQQEEQATEAVEAAQHDPQGTCHRRKAKLQ